MIRGKYIGTLNTLWRVEKGSLSGQITDALLSVYLALGKIILSSSERFCFITALLKVDLGSRGHSELTSPLMNCEKAFVGKLCQRPNLILSFGQGNTIECQVALARG